MVFDKLKIKLLESKLKKAKAGALKGSKVIDSKIKQLSKEGKLREKISVEADKLKLREAELKAKISKTRGDPARKKKLESDLKAVKQKLNKAGLVALGGLKLLSTGLTAVSKHMDEVEKRKKKTTTSSKKKKKKTTSKKK